MTNNIESDDQTMEKLYSNRNQTGDVTFLVESQRIRAHRNVLAARSPEYNAQFKGPIRNLSEIHVPNVSAAAFNIFLQFFYKKTIELTMDNIGMVLVLAE